MFSETHKKYNYIFIVEYIGQRVSKERRSRLIKDEQTPGEESLCREVEGERKSNRKCRDQELGGSASCDSV